MDPGATALRSICSTVKESLPIQEAERDGDLLRLAHVRFTLRKEREVRELWLPHVSDPNFHSKQLRSPFYFGTA
jgi:hypothetical protein